MAPLMCSSPPSHLQLLSPPSQLRPPPDPPPCTPLHVPLEAPSPPEPPDPPDSHFHLVFLQLFDTSLSFSQTISKFPDLECFLWNMDFVISVRVVSFVSVGDIGFASKRLLPAGSYQRSSNMCFSDVLISLVWYLDLVRPFTAVCSPFTVLCSYAFVVFKSFFMELVCLPISSTTLCGFGARRSMLKIRDTSNTEVLIKGCLAILRIVNCAFAAVSISECISLLVVFNSEGFVSLFSLMFVEFRGLLYVISCLSGMFPPIFICCICFLVIVVSLALMAMLSCALNTFSIHED